MILYLCDLKACEDCRCNNKDCIYTSDINHAVNFVKVGENYIEQQRDSLAELVKELNRLCENYKELKEDGGFVLSEIPKMFELAIGAIAKKIYEVE